MLGNCAQLMQLLTTHLPKRWVEAIDTMVRDGIYPNRSEAIRYGIRDFLKQEGYWPLEEEAP